MSSYLIIDVFLKYILFLIISLAVRRQKNKIKLTFPLRTMFWLPQRTDCLLTLFPDAWRDQKWALPSHDDPALDLFEYLHKQHVQLYRLLGYYDKLTLFVSYIIFVYHTKRILFAQTIVLNVLLATAWFSWRILLILWTYRLDVFCLII